MNLPAIVRQPRIIFRIGDLLTWIFDRIFRGPSMSILEAKPQPPDVGL